MAASSLRLSNNGLSTLPSGALSSDTSITVVTGDGAKFPALSAGQFFMATLVQSGGSFEIVKVTARSGDVLTVTRAQEGTAALTFAAGSRIEHRLTAGSVMDELARADADIATAQAAANSAQSTANAALPRSGGTMTGDITFKGGQQFPGAATTGKAIAMTIVFGG